MQMLYQGASAPFTRNLYSQKLQQMNCVRLRTMMTNSNPLSNIWTMGRTDRWGTYVRRRSVFPQWQWHFIQTIICREEKCHSIASTKNSANRALTLVPWPLHELSVTLAWIKCMNAWDLLELLEQCVCRLMTMDQILRFLCPEETGCSPLKTTFAPHCRFWEVIAADCMGPFPVTNLRNWYILNIGDLFTKYIETAALPSVETAINTLFFYW